MGRIRRQSARRFGRRIASGPSCHTSRPPARLAGSIEAAFLRFQLACWSRKGPPRRFQARRDRPPRLQAFALDVRPRSIRRPAALRLVAFQPQTRQPLFREVRSVRAALPPAIAGARGRASAGSLRAVRARSSRSCTVDPAVRDREARGPMPRVFPCDARFDPSSNFLLTLENADRSHYERGGYVLAHIYIDTIGRLDITSPETGRLDAQ